MLRIVLCSANIDLLMFLNSEVITMPLVATETTATGLGEASELGPFLSVA